MAVAVAVIVVVTGSAFAGCAGAMANAARVSPPMISCFGLFIV